MKKFNIYLDSIITEAIDPELPAYKAFIWRWGRELKPITSDQIKKELALKILNKLEEEIKSNINKEIELMSPAGEFKKVHLIEYDKDKQIITIKNSDELVQRNQWNLGMVMTKNSFKYFQDLYNPIIDEIDQQRKVEKEEQDKKEFENYNQRKTTYSFPDIKKFIEENKSIVSNYCFNNEALTDEWKSKFSSQHSRIKLGFINYLSNFKYDDPSIKYAELDQRLYERKQSDANKKLEKLVEELKQL